jgi:hypothetical protein
MPVVESQGGPVAGRFHRPKQVTRVAVTGAYVPPVDEVRDALRVVARKADWQRLRVATWELWLELVTHAQPVPYVNTEVRRRVGIELLELVQLGLLPPADRLGQRREGT